MKKKIKGYCTIIINSNVNKMIENLTSKKEEEFSDMEYDLANYIRNLVFNEKKIVKSTPYGKRVEIETENNIITYFIIYNALFLEKPSGIIEEEKIKKISECDIEEKIDELRVNVLEYKELLEGKREVIDFFIDYLIYGCIIHGKMYYINGKHICHVINEHDRYICSYVF